MSSFGEASISLNSTIIGKIRVQTLYAGSAIYPRICLQLGVWLREPVSSDSLGESAIQRFELRDLTGEIRFAEHADVIGALTWTGERRPVQSSGAGYEAQIVCTCDLDPLRIELIERRRNGAAPNFFLSLWPTLVPADLGIAQVPSFPMRVPRDTWIEFLGKAGVHEYEVVELHYGPGERDHFRRALDRLKESRDKVRAGEYDEAVALCRKVVEAAGHDLAVTGASTALQELFVRTVGEKRGNEYSGIVSKLKQLGAFAHHEFGAPMEYSRAKAQFVIRVTEATLSLASHLAGAQAVAPAR